MIDKQLSDCFLESQQLRITKKGCKAFMPINLFFFLMILIILLFREKYVVCLLFGILLIPLTIYLYYKMRKKWDFLTGTFIFFVNTILLTLSANMGLYAIWVLLNVFNGTTFLGIVLLEGILLIGTSFWRIKRITQGKFRAYKQSTSIIAKTLPGIVAICGWSFLRFQFVNYTVEVQTLIASITFVVFICIGVVFLGWTIFPMYYLCSKFGIPKNVEISY